MASFGQPGRCSELHICSEPTSTAKNEHKELLCYAVPWSNQVLITLAWLRSPTHSLRIAFCFYQWVKAIIHEKGKQKSQKTFFLISFTFVFYINIKVFK